MPRDAKPCKPEDLEHLAKERTFANVSTAASNSSSSCAKVAPESRAQVAPEDPLQKEINLIIKDRTFVEEPRQQARMVRSVWSPKLKEGSSWYVVSKRWWSLWKDYSHFDSADGIDDDDDTQIRRTSSGVSQGGKPPEIDNSHLIVSPDRLQHGLQEQGDFVLMHEVAWKLLSVWFGGGPEIRRRVVSTDGTSSNLIVELYPLWLSVYKVDVGGYPQRDSKMEVPISKVERVGSALKSLCENLEIRDSSDDGVRLWYRPGEIDSGTDLATLEGWTQMQPSSTFEEVTDGCSLLLEQSHIATESSGMGKKRWPFFHRMRIDYKNQRFKDASDPATVLEDGDLIDAKAVVNKHYGQNVVKEDKWYAATVLETNENKILLQYHGKDKPEVDLSLDTFVTTGSKGITNVAIGETYEAKNPNNYSWGNSQSSWHPVQIKSKNWFSDTYDVTVLDERNISWDRVSPADMRTNSKLTAEGIQALSKAFHHYQENGKIESGRLKGMMSCCLNEYIADDSIKVSSFLKEYGDGTCINIDQFLAYWLRRLSAGTSEKEHFTKKELVRLLQRVNALPAATMLLQQGREWVDLGNRSKLAQYRSKSEPSYSSGQDRKDFRDFRTWDDVDVKMDGVWQQARVREINWEELAVLVETKQPDSTYGNYFTGQKEWIPIESERLAPYQTKSVEGPEDDDGPFCPRRKSSGLCLEIGACGLNNIGNTCFFNSVVQCLSNTPELREFFAGGPTIEPAYKAEVSTGKLSMQGRLAREFSHLLRQMWSNRETSIAPRPLKKVIGEKAPEFQGFQQHDAQELMSILLDGLHEDVNRASAREPPPEDLLTDAEKKQMSDEQLAEHEWSRHKLRNDSKIVDMFQFQIRSELQCPRCKNVSVKFDPTMYLSLPVPKPPHTVPVTVCPLDYPATPMRVVKIELPKTATFAECEAALWTQLGRERVDTCFSFADVFNCRIWKQFEKMSSLASVMSNDKIYAFEVMLSHGVLEADHTFVPVVFRKTKKPTGAMRDVDYTNFATPSVVAAAKGTTCADVHSRLNDLTEKMLRKTDMSQPWNFEIRTDLDKYGRDTGRKLASSGDPFLPPPLVGVDFDESLSEKIGQQLDEDANPKKDQGGATTGSSGTTLETCLKKYSEWEQLSELDTAYCSTCKDHIRQYKKIDLWSTPEVLIVHFKRFGRDSVDGPLVRIGIPIEFPKELDVAPYLKKEGSAAKYELYAVVNHMGNMGGGHYVAQAVVRNGGPGEWFNFDDSRVDRTSIDRLDKESAYLLFYRRI